MNERKRETIGWTKQPNQENINAFREKESYKYLGVLEAKVKWRNRSEGYENYWKPNNRKIIKGMNTWAVVLVRYSRPFLNWTRLELKNMEQRKRKLMTMHMRDDLNRWHCRKRRRRKRNSQHWTLCGCSNSGTWRIYKKEQREINHSSQEQ